MEAQRAEGGDVTPYIPIRGIDQSPPLLANRGAPLGNRGLNAIRATCRLIVGRRSEVDEA
jgi:hypothetical protein